MHPATFSWEKGALSPPAKDNPRYYVLFTIDRQCYALPLEHVDRAVRMVACTAIPEMPDGVLGIINVAGQTLPVIDLRHLFGQMSKDPELQDRLLILKVKERMVAAVVDEVLSVEEFTSEQIEPPSPALTRSRALAATIRHDNALVMILDTYRLFPEKPEDSIEEANL